jgi:hypothetical protein
MIELLNDTRLYKKYLGNMIEVTIGRPMGSRHPCFD